MPKKSEGGWSGIGMANSGIDPTHVYFLNDHPTQIPPSEILGPVVQNCRNIEMNSLHLLMSLNNRGKAEKKKGVRKSKIPIGS